MSSNYPSHPQSIGDHLLKRRMDLNLLQREVAVRLGVNEATIHNWETGNHSISLSAWPGVLRFLGYDPRPPGLTIGEKLQRHRVGLGLSAAEVARQWGVDPATVTKYELKEDRLHNHLSLPRIAGFLGYSPLPPPQTPGHYLRQVRYLSGLKQAEFATRLRVSNNTVSEWELEQRLPKVEHLARVEAISMRLPEPLRLPCPEPFKTECAAALRPDRRTEPRSTYPDELKTLGDHIRKRRLDQGLSQAAVAKQLGVNRNAVTNWETGLQEPDLAQMPSVVEFLGYEPSIAGEGLVEMIRAKRRSLGLTQGAFGELIGVSRETVNLWERAKREPSGVVLERLTVILKPKG